MRQKQCLLFSSGHVAARPSRQAWGGLHIRLGGLLRSFILALPCAVVQGAWAWYGYGHPQTKPSFYGSFGGKTNVVVINTEAELAYITQHFDEFAWRNHDGTETDPYVISNATEWDQFFTI